MDQRCFNHGMKCFPCRQYRVGVVELSLSCLLVFLLLGLQQENSIIFRQRTIVNIVFYTAFTDERFKKHHDYHSTNTNKGDSPIEFLVDNIIHAFSMTH